MLPLLLPMSVVTVMAVAVMATAMMLHLVTLDVAWLFLLTALLAFINCVEGSARE